MKTKIEIILDKILFEIKDFTNIEDKINKKQICNFCTNGCTICT